MVYIHMDPYGPTKQSRGPGFKNFSVGHCFFSISQDSRETKRKKWPSLFRHFCFKAIQLLKSLPKPQATTIFFAVLSL